MRGASTLLPHVSEISFPIQKRIEFGRLGELDLVDPAGALGVFIDELGLADQRAYLMLWARSALGMRRRFYQSMKTLVMAATYSMDAVWPLIGYAGPLLHVPAP